MDNQETEKQFGLGELSPNATNKLFTQEDFEAALEKVFPRPQSLLIDKVLPET